MGHVFRNAIQLSRCEDDVSLDRFCRNGLSYALNYGYHGQPLLLTIIR